MAAAPTSPTVALLGLSQGRIKRMSDMIMAVLLITIIAMLIVPLPSWLLDTLLIVNIASSVTILMVSLYNNDPLEMSVFPSLLLIMTLYRLSLNVAATKLILGQGHAGAIISGKTGTPQGKVAALEAAGVPVADTPHDVVALVQAAYAKLRGNH